MAASRTFFCIFLLVASSLAIDYSVYKTCEEREFCNRLRTKSRRISFNVIPNAHFEIPSGVSLLLLNRDTERYVEFNITILAHNTLHIFAEELEIDRYRVPYVLDGSPQYSNGEFRFYEDRMEANFADEYRLIIDLSAIMHIYRGDELVFEFNTEFGFTMDHTEEIESFSFDVKFPQALRAYGIPEHADGLALKTTTDTSEPYRLYNSDTPGYEVDSKLGLYGSIPLLYAHGTTGTIGLFMANAAEQWVDITNGDGVSAFFIAEGGSCEFYLLFGPKPEDVAVQYTQLTGRTPIPQLWVLGYHQSSRSYSSQEDVKDVVAEFDNHGIPIDVVWGDVEIHDSYKYFTWDTERFNDPKEMLENISATNRKFVAHVSPHFLVDSDYFVYAEANENGYFVKNLDGSNYISTCLPGESSWIDFLNDQAVEWYSGLFSYSRYENTDTTLGGINNDMNEPAVFDDETERTISRDVVFGNNILHRDVHNLYGHTQARATFQGLMNRDNRELRPFVLSRSFFAGTQRFAGVYTGDNTADWGHLKESVAMCLSISLAGISMCGANVGGSFGDPSEELLTRWYQIGAWLPFFRGHASNTTVPREPYLLEEESRIRITEAIQNRYNHLPLFYTLFYEHYRSGYPVIRPIFYGYPEDDNVIDIDDQILLGDRIMIKAISEPEVATVPVYFPGGSNELWYDIDSPLLYRGISWVEINTNPDYLPVFYRGGSIIFKRMTNRRNTNEYHNDPYTAYVFLNDNHFATGTLYQDDYKSFAYARFDYSYFNFTFQDETITIEPIDPGTPTTPSFQIASYVLYRPPASKDFISTPIKPLIITKTVEGKNLMDIDYSAAPNRSMRLLL